MDDDLNAMSLDELRAEVRKLRAGIRQHRDNSGNDLCWYTPELWTLLPDKVTPSPMVPDWCEFLQKCAQYRKSLDTSGKM